MDLEKLYAAYRKNPSVQTDTRKLKPGDLFFALKGPSFNGNAFAARALEMGAALAVIDEEGYAVEGKTLLVPDVLTALQELARHHRRQLAIPFLAITGSNGKTTTKELIHAVLSATFRTSTTEGNLNNHIGVPLTLLRVPSDAQMAVIEMGANHQKEIESYCRVALPTHGLITNIGKAHLEGFGGEEGVRKGKGELFDFLRAHGGTAFVNTDDPKILSVSEGIREIIPYGSKDGKVTGRAGGEGQFLTVHFDRGFAGSIRTQLVGDYNLPNVLAAVTVGLHFGVAPDLIRRAIESYTPTNSRSQLVERGTNRIILDAYNANPSSMKAAIQNFARLPGNNKILALGAMAELGPGSLDEHRGIIEEIAKHPWKEVLLVGGDFMRAGHSYRSFETPTQAGEWLKGQGLTQASFLIKGSRSMQMEKVLDYL